MDIQANGRYLSIESHHGVIQCSGWETQGELTELCYSV